VTDVSVRAPHCDADWSAYYDLRWRILRAPWKKHGSSRDETDDSSIHRMVVCNGSGKVIAVGRLHRLDDRQGQIRYMAVEHGYERQGSGSLLLASLEKAAQDMDLETVILHARENALPFYRHHGYTLVKRSYLLFDEIQHYLMSKRVRA
jgi:N-acetylglutamate synthase-like GNAT family acetyltransferase